MLRPRGLGLTLNLLRIPFVVGCGKSYVCFLPRDILVNAVEAGLRLVFVVAGQVEGEDSEAGGSLRGRRRDLYVLWQDK